ncbi:MAG: hypothetical protein U5L08_14265 [Xanthomonadales bacterium]|nr:hypothetical protein [Xanthomonadales bacterium]
MSHHFLLSRFIFFVALAALAASPIASAQDPGSAFCQKTIRSTDTLTARISAEINGHGDLLLLLDADEGGGPEYALHGAPQQPEDVLAALEALQAISVPAEVRLLFRGSVAPSGFEIVSGQDDSERIRVLTGTLECFPDETATDLWLTGLAHYSLSTFEPLAQWTVNGLRERSLVQKPD